MKFVRYSLMAVLVAVVMAGCSEPNSLEGLLRSYVDASPAEIGVAVIIPYAGKDGSRQADTIVINDGMYPMNSVLKLFQALPTARAMQSRSIAWDSLAAIPRSSLDLDTWSPMLSDMDGDTLRVTYGRLMDFALSHSDNNACDVLMATVCGIDSITAFWRGRGLDDFQIKWNEAQMHADPERSADNCVSPLTAARLIGDTHFQSMISSDFVTSQIAGSLMHCSTGQRRIPAGIMDVDAIIAHKTGTGFDDAEGHPTGINDAAFVILPDGRSYSLAVFVKSSRLDMEQTELLIFHISSIVFNYVTSTNPTH